MDDMEEYEIKDIIDNIKYLDKNEWERTRLSIYSSVQMNTKKKLKPEDVIKFPWEREEKQETVEITSDDIERLKEKSKNIASTIKNAK